MKFIKGYITILIAVLLTLATITYFWVTAATTIIGIKAIKSYRREIGEGNRYINVNRLDREY